MDLGGETLKQEDDEESTASEHGPVCSYCISTEPSDEHMFECVTCKKYVHISCLKTGRPSSLEGDTFFLFTCCSCAEDNIELVKRMYLTWKQVVILTLYNLHIVGHGRKGFFRFKEDICQFINDNWAILFGVKSVTGRGQWYGTVAGVLSSGHRDTFLSGQTVLNTSGWWSLANIKPPDFRPENFGDRAPRSKSNKSTSKESKLNDMFFLGDFKSTGLRSSRKRRPGSAGSSSTVPSKDGRFRPEVVPTAACDYVDEAAVRREWSARQSCPTDEMAPSSSVLIHNMHSYTLTHKTSRNESQFTPIGSPQGSHGVANCGADSNPSKIENAIPGCMAESISGFSEAPSMGYTDQRPPANIADMWSTDKHVSEASRIGGRSQTINQPVEVASVANLDDCGVERKPLMNMETFDEHNEAINFTAGSQTSDNDDSMGNETIVEKLLVPFTPFEEQKLLTTLDNSYSIIKNTTELMRLRRKLALRQLKRERGLEVLDVDSKIRSTLTREVNKVSQPACWTDPRPSSDFHIRILDRYSSHGQERFTTNRYEHADFFTRLTGSDSDQYSKTITSCYTSRILKPYIWQDFEATPLKLLLMLELKALLKTKGICCDMMSLKYPIDYCYVQPHHIPTINSICNDFFWQGIDLSESLQYPDFSVVALYRKLIIGFAFMIPDVQYHEAYIPFLFVHPEWRGDSIASFMLYHLIQTCYGKDVTLHVSASNPAMILYQKFGFKCEKLLLNFYDKYFPTKNKECRHAFFLRLKR